MACKCENKGLEKIAESYRGCDRDDIIHSLLELYACLSCDGIFQRYVNHRGKFNSDVCNSDDFYKNKQGGWREICSDYLPYMGGLTKQEIIDNPDSTVTCEEPVIMKRECSRELEKIAETQPRTSKKHRGTITEHTEYFECGCCDLLFYKELRVGDAEFNAFWEEMTELRHAVSEEENLKRLKGFHYKGHFLELGLTKDEIVEQAPKCSGSAFRARETIKKLRKKR